MIWRYAKQLWVQVLVAMVAGVLLGLYHPQLGAAMRPLGDLFIALVRMLIAPIIFCTVVHGIAGMRDMGRAGRVALKAIIYFEVVTTIALAIGLVAVNLFHPGQGMNIDPAALDTSDLAQYTTQAQHQSFVEFFTHIIPTTFTSAFVEGSTLQVLLVSILFATGLTMVGERGRPVFDLIGNITQIFFKIVHIVMYVAPIGAFGAIAFTVGRFGASSLLSLGALIAEFYFVCFIFAFVVLAGIAALAGVHFFRLLYHIRQELLLVAATTSSESVLPQLIERMEEAGAEESVVGLVVPAGYSFNLDGTSLYLTTAAIFLAQATNTHLDIGQQLLLLAVLLLTSKGAAGVSGSAFIVLAGTLSVVGTIPVASVALILGIHRILGEALTFVNVTGYSVATLVVARWEKAIDPEKFRATVGFRPRIAAVTEAA